MSSSDAQAVPVWTVTRTEDTTISVAGRGLARGKRVHYRLFDGSTGYIELPLADFTPQRVASMIDDQAATELEVGALSSTQTVQPPPSY